MSNNIFLFLCLCYTLHMKILHVITKGEVGGAQQVVLNLARQQKNSGHEVTITWGDGEYLREEAQKLKINYTNFKYLKRSINPLFGLFFIWELKKYLQKNNFDTIHFHSSNTLIGAIAPKIIRDKKIKAIFTFHGLSVLDPNYETSLLKRIIFWSYFKLFLILIDEKIFLCNYNLNIAKKIKLVKNGTIIHNQPSFDNLNSPSREEAQKILSEKYKITLADKFVIGSVGRLAYPKNYEFIISIFPEILKIKPNAVCVIIGEGPERKKYEALIEKLNLKNNIFLIGEIKNGTNYIKAFDLLVLPSKYEGMSITLLDAKVAGIKILASNVGGNAEILTADQIYKLDNEGDFIKKLKTTKIYE